MLKTYTYNGLTFQFEEGKQPAGAKEVAPKETAKEVKKPNKAAKKSNK